LWTPASYGSHQIDISTTTANGDTASLTKNIQVTSTVSTRTVTTLQDVVIEFGGANNRWFYGTYTLPQFVGSYAK